MSKSYLEPHRFIYFPVSDEFCALGKMTYCFRRMAAAPVFPDFIKADFSSYEGFRKFSEQYGLDSIACLSTSLKQDLDKRIAAARGEHTRKPISRAFLKREWKKIRGDLSNHQLGVQKLSRVQQELQEGEEILVIHRDQEFLISPLKNQRVQALPYSNFAHVLPFLSQKKERWILGPEPAPLKCTLDTSDPEKMDPENPPWKMKPVFLFTEDDESKMNDPYAWETPGDGESPSIMSADDLRDNLKSITYYDSIVSRCYSEITSLIIEEKTTIPCALCKRHFIPKRIDNIYCDRTFTASPKYEREHKELVEESDLPFQEKLQRFDDLNKRHSCRNIGPRTNYELRLSNKPDKGKYRAEYQKLSNHMGYLKKKHGPESSEYLEAKSAFEEFKKTKKRGGRRSGKTRAKRG